VEPLWLCREIVSEHLFERYFKGLTKGSRVAGFRRPAERKLLVFSRLARVRAAKSFPDLVRLIAIAKSLID
jgi:hypothetical protein